MGAVHFALCPLVCGATLLLFDAVTVTVGVTVVTTGLAATLTTVCGTAVRPMGAITAVAIVVVGTTELATELTTVFVTA